MVIPFYICFSAAAAVGDDDVMPAVAVCSRSTAVVENHVVVDTRILYRLLGLWLLYSTIMTNGTSNDCLWVGVERKN